MEIAQIRDLSFIYRGSASPALSVEKLNIARGELVLLCGASGSGKSTLLHCLKTSLRPAGELTGEIRLFSQDTASLSPRQQAAKIGFVGQSPEAMIVTDKVWHELAFSAENLGLSREEISRRIGETAEFFGLSDLLDRSCDTLSGGQKQLLALAAASVCVPELLLLDEPLSQLDPVSASSFLSAVLRLNRELGVTVLLSEHRLDEVFPLADRIVLLENGRVAADASPQAIADAVNGDFMKQALPAPARIWSCCGRGGSCPVSVSEGRDWLAKKLDATEAHTLAVHEPEKRQTAVSLKKLSFRFERKGRDVISGLSAEIGRGEIFGIIGANGAGKSTLLSLICGTKRPYSGRAELQGEAALLSQDPRMLFVKSDLLSDIADASALPEEDSLSAAREALRLVGLNGFEERHPLDLSGGEQQLAALAKLIAADRQILLLDEPTKGVDPLFKARIAALLRTLSQSEKTIILVSHDIAFCAEVCDRCAMLFGGELVGTDVPQRFFSGSSYYTSAASRMARGYIENAVTVPQIIEALGGHFEPYNSANGENKLPDKKSPDKTSAASKKKRSAPRLVKGLALLSFAVSVLVCSGFPAGAFARGDHTPYILLALSAVLVMLVFGIGSKPVRREHQPVKDHAAVYFVTALLVVPATLVLSARYINSGKFLFVSLVVLLETLAPFYLSFERRRASAREAVTVAVLTAAAVAGRAAFYMLPQFKPVLAVVILSGCGFGAETGFLVGSMSMLISNSLFGQGPWTPWQMYSMGLCGLLAGVIFSRRSKPAGRTAIALSGMILAVAVYGAVVNPSTLFIMRTEITKTTLTAVYTAGFPLDIIHGVATMLFLYALAPGFLERAERLRTKYFFFERQET